MPSPKAPLLYADMSFRAEADELMDSPGADERKLERTVRQFELLNRLFSSALPLYKRHLLPALRRDPGREWRILDFGSGGCDLDRALVRLCRREGLMLRIVALDADPRMLPWAQDACRDYPEIEPRSGSVFDVDEDFDFILSNHTLHHFSWEEVRRAVELCGRRARSGYLLNDLRRSAWAYLGFTIFTGLFVRNSLAFADGRLSIRRGFTVGELEGLLRGTGARLGTAAPARVYVHRF